MKMSLKIFILSCGLLLHALPDWVNTGSGKCQTWSGGDPSHSYYHGIGYNRCKSKCSSRGSCKGFSVSSFQNCLIWTQGQIMGGGNSWGSADCILKNNESPLSNYRKFENRDCGGSVHTRYQKLWRMNRHNGYSIRLNGRDYTWDRTAQGCQSICSAFSECGAVTVTSHQQCDMVKARVYKVKPYSGGICYFNTRRSMIPPRLAEVSLAAISPTETALVSAQDCQGTWSTCTDACETASQRVFTETQRKVGNGAECPENPGDCELGEDFCVGDWKEIAGADCGMSPVGGARWNRQSNFKTLVDGVAIVWDQSEEHCMQLCADILDCDAATVFIISEGPVQCDLVVAIKEATPFECDPTLHPQCSDLTSVCYVKHSARFGQPSTIPSPMVESITYVAPKSALVVMAVIGGVSLMYSILRCVLTKRALHSVDFEEV